MPVGFPNPPREPKFLQLPFLFAKPFDVIPAPNFTVPSLGYFADPQRSSDALQNGALSNSAVRQFNQGGNLRSLGLSYVDVISASQLNPVGKGKGKVPFFWDRKYAKLNRAIGGISRDAGGAILGNCTMMLFRTSERSLYAETISNAAGVWSIGTLESGPFFIVSYKAGVPDVTGASLNTVTTDAVSYG